MSQKREKKKRERAARERKYAARKAASVAQFPAGHSTPLIQHFQFESPFQGLSEAARRAVIQKVGEEAERSFSAGVDALNSLVLKHDPFELLAAVAFYTQFQGVGPNTDFTASPEIPQALVETLQSLCLRHTTDQFGTAPVLHPDLGAVLDQLTNCSKSFATKRFQTMAKAEHGQKHLNLAIESARMHTQVMRNWGYPQHMRAIVNDLFAPLEEVLLREVGVSAAQLQELFHGIHEMVCDRAMGFIRGFADCFRQKGKKNVVSAFCKLARVSPEEEEGLQRFIASRPITDRGLKLFMMSYFHQYLPSVFTFTAEECLSLMPTGANGSRLQSILDTLAFHPGGLNDIPCEHLFMQSPVRTKPFIRVDSGTYFLPVVGLLHSYFVETVESLIFANAAVKRVYHKRRAVYLETTVTQMVRAAFPNCPVYSGTQGIHPTDGKDFENDCFAVVGPVAVVFEAKSERVEDSARRGASNTLKSHYKSMVQEPAMQATRFAQLLESGHGVHRFATTAGEEYQLDLSAIRRVVSVSVTLDWFPSTSMCWRQLRSAGLVTDQDRPALHVNLADLQVLCEVLTRPAVFLHYLWRRSEWEEYVDYLGDEEDLLVYYLSEGLVALGALRDGSAAINLYGRSEELHRFYMADWAGEVGAVPRPKRILTRWWEAVLDRVATRTYPQKWDIACVLLDLSYSQQASFEKEFEQVVRSVRRDQADYDAVLFAAGQSESQGAIVGFAYRPLTREVRHARAEQLAGQAHTEFGATRVVVIGRDIDRHEEAYSFLAFVCYSAGGQPDELTRVPGE